MPFLNQLFQVCSLEDQMGLAVGTRGRSLASRDRDVFRKYNRVCAGRVGKGFEPSTSNRKSGELEAFGSIKRLSIPNLRIQSNSRYCGGPGEIRLKY